MIVGLPGAGISTVFYLLCVLVMPFRALWTVVRGGRLSPGEGRRICRQLVIALGILVAFGIAGILLGAVLPQPAAAPSVVVDPGAAGDAAPAALSLPRIVGPAAVAFAFLTLAVVLGLVRLLAVLLPRAGQPRAARTAVVAAGQAAERVAVRRDPSPAQLAARRPASVVPARET
jgi:hypothetical protein